MMSDEFTENLEALHRLAHMAPDYHETMATDDLIINLAASASEVTLMRLGLCLIVEAFPCLTTDALTFDERLVEIIEAQIDGADD